LLGLDPIRSLKGGCHHETLGDTFIGAFIGAIAQGRDQFDAIAYAQAAAALSVTRVGAQTSIPTRDEVVL